MPIEVGLWRMGEKPSRLKPSPMASESGLEDAITADVSIIDDGYLVIGRQVQTDHGKLIDVLAMTADGDLVIIELKKGRTPREVVAQLLDHASWAQDLSRDEIVEIYETKHPGLAFEEGFAEKFGDGPPEELNQSHELLLVASELDPASERIINYLSDSHDVPINAVFFQHFRDGTAEYLSRTWLISPSEVIRKAGQSKKKKGQEPWNGRDFYVSVGEGDHQHRSWEDCRKYGFVSAGGGTWYTQTLKLLFPGARIFVNLPKQGYVGIGTVTAEVVPVTEFTVPHEGKDVPLLDMPLAAKRMDENNDDAEKIECVVRVEWIKTVPREQAYWEKGLFAIQHSACRMRSSFTIEKVTELFGVAED